MCENKITGNKTAPAKVLNIFTKAIAFKSQQDGGRPRSYFDLSVPLIHQHIFQNSVFRIFYFIHKQTL